MAERSYRLTVIVLCVSLLAFLADKPAQAAPAQEAMFKEMVAQGMVEGVRRVELIAPDLLAVTLDGLVARGVGPGEESAQAFQKPEVFTIRSDSGQYKAGVKPVQVGRESYEYWNSRTGPLKQNVIYWHTYYLKLPAPLETGQSYTVVVSGIESPYKNSATLVYDKSTTITRVIKVNQVAYSSLQRNRYAYLGWWAGDMGKVDYAAMKEFQIIDEATGQPALTGPITLRRADDKLSGEDVYQMDLSGLKPGRYHIVVTGLARSDSFGVGGPGIQELYFHTMRAFYHQRCGYPLAKPYTDFEKPICHIQVYESGYMVGNPNYTPKPGEAIKEFKGGYHDAADFDVFTYHLRATAQVLSAYEFAPEKFKDGDLNIPESGNGIPDVLDEAEWALFGYREMQQEDGGVPRGRGHDQDAIRDWARAHEGQRPKFGIFPAGTSNSLEYAATAAQYARIIQAYDKPRAEKYIQSARRALAWALANPDVAEREKEEQSGRLFTLWAAAELYHATGDEEIHAAFKKAYADGGLSKLSWRVEQAVPLCTWAYIHCKQPGVDKGIQDEMRKHAISRAEELLQQTEKAPYRVGMGEKAANLGWGNGNGGGRYADPLLRAYMLTRDRKYLDAACLNADFQLGANPLSKTFISGIGARPPLHPLISAFLYTGPNKTGTTVKGITVYGLASRQPKWYPQFPVWRCWRDLGNVEAYISSEFTITETIGASAMLYGTLYALEP